MGEWSVETGAGSVLGFIQDNGWDLSGNPQPGMIYYNTTDLELRLYVDGNWKPILRNDQAGAVLDDLKVLGTVYVSGGRIGVGTDTPSTGLHLKGDDPISHIRLENPAGGDVRIITYDNQDLFQIKDGGIGGTRYLTINGTTGNIGVNTVTPAKKLDVNGDISLESGSGSYYSSEGNQGWSGKWTNAEGDTVTVEDGIIVSVASS